MSSGEPQRSVSETPPYERIEPLSRVPRAGARGSGAQRAGDTLKWISAAVALLAAGWILFNVLPRSTVPDKRPVAAVQDTPPAATEPPVAGSAEPAVTAPAEIAPYQRAELQRQRNAAEEILGELVTKQFDLERKGVDQWGAEGFAAARASALRGDEAFGFRNYTEAADAYREAVAAFDELLSESERVLAGALAAGERALAVGDAQSAATQFELALAVEPGNATAARGLERAAQLDRVLAVIEQARGHERRSELDQARERYRAALELDPDYRPARDALTRVEEQLAALGFEQVLSAGYAALSRREFRAARDAFQRALAMRPGSANARDGLAQTELELKLAQIAGHRERAASAIEAEHWSEAVEQYEAALELDANLLFAREGLPLARERAALADGLQSHIDHSERLTDESAQRNAQQLLAQAQAVPAPGPTLRVQMQRLAELLQIARTPVTVQLLSDNKTDVVLFKIGELGSFDSRELELSPGTYTALGRRDGYRDVRRQFTIVAGQPPEPVVIQCEDAI